jgi:murein DD-endopeptidase MepM/ murein hydrolase activator NlpD
MPFRSRRRWTLIIVPPNPTSRPRRLGISTRTFTTAAMLMLAIFAAQGLWVAAGANAAAVAADRLAEAQRSILALHDTVASMRTTAWVEAAKKRPPVDMIMPVAGEVTSRFSRARFHPVLQLFRAHRGVDLSAPIGTRVVAPANGTVRSVGWRIGYGLTIEMEHSGGVVTRYAHLRSAYVRRGDQVAMGTAIAAVGTSGLSTGPHLHFEVLVNGRPVDPIKFLASTRDTTNTVAERMPAGDNH